MDPKKAGIILEESDRFVSGDCAPLYLVKLRKAGTLKYYDCTDRYLSLIPAVEKLLELIREHDIPHENVFVDHAPSSGILSEAMEILLEKHGYNTEEMCELVKTLCDCGTNPCSIPETVAECAMEYPNIYRPDWSPRYEYAVTWQYQGDRRRRRVFTRPYNARRYAIILGPEPWKAWGAQPTDPYRRCRRAAHRKAVNDGAQLGHKCPFAGPCGGTMAEHAEHLRAALPPLVFVRVERRIVGDWELCPDDPRESAGER